MFAKYTGSFYNSKFGKVRRGFTFFSPEKFSNEAVNDSKLSAKL